MINKRRKAIVEQAYGTIKRQWGFSYVLTKKGIGRASCSVELRFIAYNLRRIGNILTQEVLKEYLRILVTSLSRILGLLRVCLSDSEGRINPSPLFVQNGSANLKKATRLFFNFESDRARAGVSWDPWRRLKRLLLKGHNG